MLRQFLCALMTLSFSSMFADIHYEVLKGEQIAPWTAMIADYANAQYREYPYFYDGTHECYTEFLTTYAKTPNGLLSIAFDGDVPIGFITGKPMSENREVYQKPFHDKKMDVASIFYVGEVVLLPKYQGKGIKPKLYANLEAAIRQNPQFKTAAIAEIDPATVKSAPPKYVPMDKLLWQLGFSKQSKLTFSVDWKNVDASKETPHHFVYWTKSL